MSLENAKVLHKHFLDKGMLKHAAQQEKNYPELKLKENVSGHPSTPPEHKGETKKDGKKSKR